ncbi:hypothetical protein Slala05_40890 [Streptomyces lavendulae subsp. lavendulae]|nr:hypothetical protein Slala05_40890 [Streptomyces lavendulae subsp. lavendulae]
MPACGYARCGYGDRADRSPVQPPPRFGLFPWWPLPCAGCSGYFPSALAVASIAASERRTWLRSVVYQKSGRVALRKLP